ALITDMNQPLGRAVGNSLEIIQSIEILKGNGPEDITKLVKYESAYMIMLGGLTDNFEEALEKVETVIKNGKALDVYGKMIAAQNGNADVINDYGLFPQTKEMIEIKSPETGYISEIDAMGVGISALILGAGRETKESIIDYAVGAVLKKKVGDYANKGDVLAEFYVNNKSRWEEAQKKFLNSYRFSKEKPAVPPLIYSVVDINSVKKLDIAR
ncbi:MAG TPA: pyrimidine-nucleoside phosphorylase, partial [bacterium]|nr:pyrimidine-nucleoside phosphorylase [bacterium]